MTDIPLNWRNASDGFCITVSPSFQDEALFPFSPEHFSTRLLHYILEFTLRLFNGWLVLRLFWSGPPTP